MKNREREDRDMDKGRNTPDSFSGKGRNSDLTPGTTREHSGVTSDRSSSDSLDRDRGRSSGSDDYSSSERSDRSSRDIESDLDRDVDRDSDRSSRNRGGMKNEM
jgi:hypothetical protein